MRGRAVAMKLAQRRCWMNGRNKNSELDGLRKDFEWSLKPVLTLMKSIGIPLRMSSSNAARMEVDDPNISCFSCRRKAFVVFSFVLFFLNVLCQCYAIVIQISFLNDESSKVVSLRSKFSSTAFWNHYIETVNNIVTTIGSQTLVLFVCFTHNWQQLVWVLQRTEQQHFYSESDYKTFRKAIYLASVLGVMVFIIT